MLEKGEAKRWISALITALVVVMGMDGTKFCANGMGLVAHRSLVTNLKMPLIGMLLVWWSRDAYSALKRSECSCWF